MSFDFELYYNDIVGKNMVFISADESLTGAEFPYEKPEDIGDAVVKYLLKNYPEKVERPY